MSTKKKCAHPACKCMARENDEYCSQYCKDAGEDDVEISCECGYAGCSLTETTRSPRTSV